MRIHYIHPRVHILNTKQQGVLQGEPRGAWASPIFSFRTTKASVFSTKAHSRFASVAALVDVLETPRPPQLVCHTWQCLWFSVALKAYETCRGPLKGAVSALIKCPSKVQDRDEGVAGRKRREYFSGTRGSLIFFCLSGPPPEYLVACDLPAKRYLFPAWEMKG